MVKDEWKEITDHIALLNNKLASARKLLFDGKLDAEDFTVMKKECEQKIKRLEISVEKVKLQKLNLSSLDNTLLKAIEAFSKHKRL